MRKSRRGRSNNQKQYFKNKGKFEAKKDISDSCGKTQYKTKKQALTKKQLGEKENKELSLYIYKCPDCHNWHLTRSEPW